ncbi:MAG: hypothetical protein AAF851_08905 [Myxococcota bacterium]
MKKPILLIPLFATACWDHYGHDDDVVVVERRTARPASVQCPEPDCPVGLDAIYLSTDPAVCNAIPYTCPEGMDAFDSLCGCGCVALDPSPAPVDTTCPEESEVLYLSQESKVCEGITFSCPEGEERFDSGCGCGCRPSCPDPTDPMVHYLSQNTETCDLIDFTCPPDCLSFDDRCGCGCIEPAPPPACPNPNDPMVHYISADPGICDQVSFECPDQFTRFDDACGCGCID